MRYLKTYKTNSNESVIKLTFANVPVECHFVNGNTRIGQWAKLTTSNEIVQRAIENSSLYGRVILLDGEPTPLEEEKKEMDAADVTNYQQLREFLVSKYGCIREKIAAPNSMKSKVREFSIDLPNMVW